MKKAFHKKKKKKKTVDRLSELIKVRLTPVLWQINTPKPTQKELIISRNF